MGSRTRILNTFIFLGLVATGVPRAGDCPVFLIKSEGGQVTAARATVAAGRTEVFVAGGESGVIDVILPPGPGGSSGDARAGNLHIVRCTGDTVEHRVRTPDGKEHGAPARPLADLRGQDIRISVTTAGAAGGVFLISAYDTVAPAPGPIQNLFAGVPIPLGNGDALIHTDTYARRQGSRVTGVMTLEMDGHPFARAGFPGGGEGWVVMDTGAAETVLTREALPAATPIEEAGMVEYSAAGRRVLDYTPGGATGPVHGVLGQARLERLDVGGLTFSDVRAVVMEDLPLDLGRPVRGIVGLDLLQRADLVTLEFPPGASGPGRLVLAAGVEGDVNDPSGAVPCFLVTNHLMVTAGVNGVPVHFILDSGAPASFLSPEAARAAGITPDETAPAMGGGLDGGKVEIHESRIGRLQLGGSVVEDVPANVAPLAVFRSLQAGRENVGLLGNDFFGRFARIELDLAGNRAWFVEAPGEGDVVP